MPFSSSYRSAEMHSPLKSGTSWLLYRQGDWQEVLGLVCSTSSRLPGEANQKVRGGTWQEEEAALTFQML